ncbi:MAG: DNA translocase FtsK [Alphaproteobacteria bacterium MarineAlpha9_Bin4]|nr:cell division protein FtsK [Pelagibacterales bacterium]PPR26825.1 MAG: DNA translocase FtsK [Alphaproteobacteria bacterium MarineAlpha9_Bin4]|tara:strand:+ start:614 stop:2758 length:2145 start_codon:yes stop_codon:yes gene_type:complete
MYLKLKNINFKVSLFKALICLFFLLFGITSGLSLLSHNEFDPSIFTVNDENPTNILGYYGANLSSILFVIYGDASWLISVFVTLLIRPTILKKYNILKTFLRFFGVIVCIFMISLSLSNLGLNSGIFGKTILVKLMVYADEFKQYDNYILNFNFCVFSFLLLFLVSRNKTGVFFFSYKFLKYSLIIIKKPFILIFRKKIKEKKGNLKNIISRSQEEKDIKNKKKNFIYPGLDFLDDPPVYKSQRNANLSVQARDLKKVLDDYGIKGDILNAKEGPVVTRYELEPAPGTRSARVISLSDDIARSMSAKSARVSVIYGKNAIGIELPNKNIDTVFLKEILSANIFEKSSGLSLALGKDISGKPLTADLSKMPHLLVAGTTGSGKSVSINAMIISLLYKFSYSECKFILIDPKMLELSVYEGIPHLLHPVVTDARKAVFALKWAVKEMNERYKQMANLGVRNIESYNQVLTKKEYKEGKLVKKVQVGFDSTSGRPIYQNKEIKIEPLPFIVIVVDEMADLMLTSGKDIEVSIQSLAQKARAAGIHLILATQRPSVDVITGTIKANLPYRISFQVTSKIDSRTILGEQGAEQLLGKGDMLFMAGGGYTERVHGPFVSDGEILKVTNFLKSQGEPSYHHYITEGEEEDSGDFKNEEEFDPLYEKALSLIKKERKISTSFLQRHFAIGYNRAARIVDSFEKKGIVSSPNSMGRREVLVED